MRYWTIGAMAVVLITTACGRKDASPAPETSPATPAQASSTAVGKSPTLAAIKRRGRLKCGVHQGLVGFAYTDNRGQWRAPFRYYSFRDGARIAPQYYGSRYFISDPWRYRLPPAGYGQRWVRHYDDMLLVDTRRGYVVRVIRNFFW